MRGGFVIDESAFPLVFINVSEGAEVAQLEEFFAAYERMLARNEPFANVTDVSRVRSRPNALVRQRLAEWTRSIESRVVRLSKADARIVNNALIRGAMTAIGWLHQHPVKQEWFSNREEAVAWAIERLEDAGVDIPAVVRSRLALRKSL
jgi:hypothetical protein